MGMPAVVTPEAVPLDLQPAGLGSRFVALLIDWTVQAMLAFALLLVGIGLSAADSGGVGIALFFLLTFAVLFGYPVAMETLWRGRTLGKAAMGLRVVTIEGGPVRLRHAAIRAALGLVDFFVTSGAAAVISVLSTRNSQRLGDLVAGTIVLRERTGLPPPRAAEFSVPAGLEWYAASLDVSGMTADDYRALRAFLLRAPTLDYRVRYRLAVGLADPLSDRVRPMAPAGIHPAWYLICVAAVYQQRTAPRPQTPWPPVPAPVPPAPSPAPSPDVDVDVEAPSAWSAPVQAPVQAPPVPVPEPVQLAKQPPAPSPPAPAPPAESPPADAESSGDGRPGDGHPSDGGFAPLG